MRFYKRNLKLSGSGDAFLPVELDCLAAAIGFGIDLQEAMDIVDLAIAGREGLSTLYRQLYDEAQGDAVNWVDQ